jgi:hypothetical protein
VMRCGAGGMGTRQEAMVEYKQSSVWLIVVVEAV